MSPLVALVAVWWSAPAAAAPPTEASVQVLLKVLSYDRALASRGDESLVFGVVWDPSEALSAAQGAETLAVLRRIDTTVGGLSVAEPIPMPAGRTDLAEAFTSVDAVFVCAGTGAVLTQLAEDAAVARRPLLALDDAAVGRGAAVGIGLRQARLRILLDLGRARAQGMEPSGELFEVAELVTP